MTETHMLLFSLLWQVVNFSKWTILSLHWDRPYAKKINISPDTLLFQAEPNQLDVTSDMEKLREKLNIEAFFDRRFSRVDTAFQFTQLQTNMHIDVQSRSLYDKQLL